MAGFANSKYRPTVSRSIPHQAAEELKRHLKLTEIDNRYLRELNPS
jgi:hypothetical protein